MSSLKEAFQEFDELDDVLYDIDNKEDIEKLRKSLDTEAEDDLDGVEKIVDINADDEEDLEQSYVGKLLLYCPFCHTIHYANKEDIVENEETPEYVNVGEQCPECDQIEGFEIIGEVAPVDNEQPSEEQGDEQGEENVETDEIDLDTEFGLPDEDEFEESFHKTKKSSFLERLLDNDCKNDDIDFDDNDGEEIEEKVGAVLPKVKKRVKENLKSKKLNENLTEAPLYDLKPQYDSRQSFYGKAQVDTGDKGDKNKLYSYDTLVAEIKDGKPVVYGTYSQTTLRHIKDWLKQNGFKAESKAQIEKDYMTEGCKTNECNLNEEVQDEAYEIAEYVYEKIKGKDLVEWDEFEDLVDQATKELYNVDLYEVDGDKVIINEKEFDVNDLVNGDIRGILGYKGYATIFEGEHEGGLTTKEIEENLNEDSERDILRANIKAQNQANKQSRLKLVKKDPKKDKDCKGDECKKEIKESKLQEGYQDVIADILERAKMNVDEGYDVDEAIFDAIDNGLIYTNDQFDILKSLFNLDDLYTSNGENAAQLVDEHIFNEIYNEVSDYFNEKNGEVNESLKKEHRTVDQIKESIKTKLDKVLTEVKGQDKYFTPKGLDHIEIAKKYGLYDYYDDMGGYYQIPKSEYGKVEDNVKRLLNDVTEYELVDGDTTNVPDYKGLMFISEKEEDDELDEKLFDNLINKYCTKVYENVKEYKTTTGYTQDNNLVLEGLLTFKSGKTSNTKFIFEKKMTKDNQVKYVGLNESFSKGKKAFTLSCKVENKKIMSESLSYNYKVTVDKQKKAVYGSVKNN